jgi:hypothetical protein
LALRLGRRRGGGRVFFDQFLAPMARLGRGGEGRHESQGEDRISQSAGHGFLRSKSKALVERRFSSALSLRLETVAAKPYPAP